jgi:ADP-ribosylglycohydrolase
MEDNIKGLIFGQAIGDALGLATEFMTREDVMFRYPNGIDGYQDIIPDRHRSRWGKGEWTDDTEQMLCIFDSLLENNEVDLCDIASRFVHWMNNNGRGLGRHTFKILSTIDYVKDPLKVSEYIWEKSGRQSAPNGGVMRTSIMGCWDYTDWESVRVHTENVCKLTHFDPRCVGSCVIVSFIISSFLQGRSCSEKDITAIANLYDRRIAPYIELAYQPDITLLKLDEEGKIGYTLKTLASALWVYNHSADFDSGLKELILQGGDADTNGAVAGALLGLKYGYSSIPAQLKDELIGKDCLEKKVALLLNKIH